MRTGPGPGGYSDEPTYVVLPVDFGNGTIDVDRRGHLAARAPRDVRAFIGIAFRTAPDHKSFESVYLRPTNGRKREPGSPRNGRAIQYFAYPDWKFDRLRRDFPDGRYEAGADIADGEWIRLRLEVGGSVVRTFVNDKLELTVNDMRLPATRRDWAVRRHRHQRLLRQSESHATLTRSRLEGRPAGSRESRPTRLR